MRFISAPWVDRWAALFFATLSACGEPQKPVATPVVAPVMTKRQLLSARPLADSIAASYGLVAGFGADAMALPDMGPTRWPVGEKWISLMPGRLPGLRAWLTTDSLRAFTHGEEPRDYSFHLRYPAFAGPRADSLRRTLGRLSNLPEELAAVRRQRLYSAPAPRTPTGDEEGEVFSECEREETNTLDCYSLGAYVVGADTVVSAAGTTYYSGHCVHGTVGRVTAPIRCATSACWGSMTCSSPPCAGRCTIPWWGMFSGINRKIGAITGALRGRLLCNKPSNGTGDNGRTRWPNRNASGKQFTNCAYLTGRFGSIRRFQATRLAATNQKPRFTSGLRV
jgi:hypothetical protein